MVFQTDRGFAMEIVYKNISGFGSRHRTDLSSESSARTSALPSDVALFVCAALDIVVVLAVSFGGVAPFVSLDDRNASSTAGPAITVVTTTFRGAATEGA